jgi:spore coat protein U-like protein
MTRFVLAMCCALLSTLAWAQFVRPPSTRAKPPPSPGLECPLQPAECQINVQAFDFGRGQMNQDAPPINGSNTISVTCTRAPRDGLGVTVQYDLQAIPPTPARQMRDNELRFLAYDMYVDPARTRYWGWADGYPGTFSFQGALFLDDRNRVGTLAHVVYGKVHSAQGFAPPGQWLGLVGVRLQYYALCQG